MELILIKLKSIIRPLSRSALPTPRHKGVWDTIEPIDWIYCSTVSFLIDPIGLIARTP